MELRVSHGEELEIFEELQSFYFQQAISKNWDVFPNNHVKAQSVLWLFCWAKTGLTSETHAKIARRIFNKIMSKSYEYCNDRIPHEFARKYRYSKNDQLVENKLAKLLEENPYQV
jgi:hypothetical protein